MIDVLVARSNERAGAEFADQLREDGYDARFATTRHFKPEQIDSGIEKVYHDGSDPLVPWSYKERGATAELIPDLRGETLHGDSEPEYRVEESRGWYSLIGPDGKIGKSQRSEDDAWALLDEES